MPNRSELIALSNGITYIWGTVGIILICKFLSRWWGVDAKAAAKKYEQEFGVRDGGFRPFGCAPTGWKIRPRSARPLPGLARRTRNINVARGGEQLGAAPDLVLRKGDVIVRGALIHIKGPARPPISIGGS